MTSQNPTPEVRVAACVFSQTEGKISVKITLRNHSPRPAFVTAGVRCIEFDASSNLLVLRFTDRGKKTGVDDPVRKDYTIPKVEVIEVGQEKILSAEIPEKMMRLIAHEDGTFDFEVLDLSNANSVLNILAVSDMPFYFNPQKGLLDQLNEWGVDIEASAQKHKDDIHEIGMHQNSGR